MFPDLFDAIGTTYGAGDGSTTFNLPNYSDGKFPEGSTVAGTVKQPGLPNITGRFGYRTPHPPTGAFYTGDGGAVGWYNDTTGPTCFDASLSNSIYGNSDTVQPYSLTCRYIIKAYDGVTPTPSEADISEMLTELTNKADRDLDNLSADGENHFLENDFTIIYPNGGSEASPANVLTQHNYVENNPFPGYYVKCAPEFFYNGNWQSANEQVLYNSSAFSAGIYAVQNNDGDIHIVTGQYICHSWIFQTTDSVNITAATPCRVKVWKIGKISD
jgi:hypothetical protein